MEVPAAHTFRGYLAGDVHMSDIHNSLSAISDIINVLAANPVARFCYTPTAYTDNDAAGVAAYNYTAEQNIPVGMESVLTTTGIVLNKGFRTMAASIPRMLLNHFFGRTSYNLNKLVDKFNDLCGVYSRDLSQNCNLYSATTPYAVDDVCFYPVTRTVNGNPKLSVEFFRRIAEGGTSGVPPVSTAGGYDTVNWSMVTIEQSQIDGLEFPNFIYGDNTSGSTLVTDADTIIKSGFYRLAADALHTPSADSFTIMHITASATEWTQIAIADERPSDVYCRQHTGSVTGNWNSIGDNTVEVSATGYTVKPGTKELVVTTADPVNIILPAGIDQHREIKISRNVVSSNPVIVSTSDTEVLPMKSFTAIGGTPRGWQGIGSDPSGNIWATTDGDIYKCPAGSTIFTAIGGTPRNWNGICSDPSGNIWAAVYPGDIYKCPAGSTTFTAIGGTSRHWYGICSDPSGNIWATVNGGDIYKCPAGSTTFTAIGGTPRSWTGICSDPSGTIWAAEVSGNIYKCPAGSTTFTAIGVGPLSWHGICSDLVGNIWAVGYSSDIYKCPAGSTIFTAILETSKSWNGICSDPSGNIWAAVFSGDIYIGGGSVISSTTTADIEAMQAVILKKTSANAWSIRKLGIPVSLSASSAVITPAFTGTDTSTVRVVGRMVFIQIRFRFTTTDTLSHRASIFNISGLPVTNTAKVYRSVIVFNQTGQYDNFPASIDINVTGSTAVIYWNPYQETSLSFVNGNGLYGSAAFYLDE